MVFILVDLFESQIYPILSDVAILSPLKTPGKKKIFWSFQGV